MTDGSTIAELRFTRQPESPDQIRTSIRLNEGGAIQLDSTLDVIENGVGYRPFNAQTKGKGKDSGELDYEAILLKNNNF